MSPSKRERTGRRAPLREELWNLPNILTYGRVVLVPVVMWYLYRARPGAPTGAEDLDARIASFTACLLFSVAAITDFLDGWIARNWDLGTMVGRFLDPLADKIIVTATLVMLVYLGRIPAWFVVLLITREMSITSLRSIASTEGLEIHVAQSGKWKTAFQLCGLVGLLVHYRYPIDFVFFTVDVDFHIVGTILLGLSMLFSIVSAVQYFYRFAEAAARKDEAEKARGDAESSLKAAGQADMVPVRVPPPPDASP